MAGVNKVILIGNLGRDPEIRIVENGAKVASFSLATTDSYKNKEGQRVEQTEWHNIVFWRGPAEVAEKYLKKGSQVYIEGKLRTRNWEDKDGHKRYTTEIIGDTFTMLGKKDENNSHQETTPASEPVSNGTPQISQESPNDDLPF